MERRTRRVSRNDSSTTRRTRLTEDTKTSTRTRRPSTEGRVRRVVSEDVVKRPRRIVQEERAPIRRSAPSIKRSAPITEDKHKNEMLVEKWERVLDKKGKWAGSLEKSANLTSDKDRLYVAEMLERTEKDLKANYGILNENMVSSADIAKYPSIVIPMIRRIAPALIGQNIMGVQPLDAPTGLIFVLRSSLTGKNLAAPETYSRKSSAVIKFDTAVPAGVQTAIENNTSIDLTLAGGGTLAVFPQVANNAGFVLVSTATNFDYATLEGATYTEAAVDYVVEASMNEQWVPTIFPLYTGPFATATGEQLSTNMPELGLDIDSVNVTAETRKLKARWTNEMDQDLKAIHNLSAQDLLFEYAALEIANEQNREFIGKIEDVFTRTTNQGDTYLWDYNEEKYGRWQAEKNVSMAKAFTDASRLLAEENKMGQGNVAVVSPQVLSCLENSGRLKTNGKVDPAVTPYAGMLNESIEIYVDNYASDANASYIGYKGDDRNAGFIWSPYVPLQQTMGIDPESGQPRAFFASRYGITENPFGAQQFWKKINFQNLDTGIFG